MDNFVQFQTADGRVIYVRRDAVTVVYDMADAPGTSVIHTPTTGMPVPYTAEQAMEVLYG